MPQKSRVSLFNDVAGDIITAALRGTSMELREAVLSSIGARQRRMIESDLAAGDLGNPREVLIARRSITQEAIRLAAAGQIQLKEKGQTGSRLRPLDTPLPKTDRFKDPESHAGSDPFFDGDAAAAAPAQAELLARIPDRIVHGRR